MPTSEDAEHPDEIGDLEGASLLDAMTIAGAAVDRAQVLGDVVAHRVVQVVAQSADGIPPMVTDIVGPPAVESERIASEVRAAAAGYERARAEHTGDIHDLAKPARPDALDDLRDVTVESVRAEADAAALLDEIDDAQDHLERRAASHVLQRTDLQRLGRENEVSPSEARLN